MPSEADYLALETRKGSSIPNKKRPERGRDALVAAIELWKELLPEARLRSISAVYNCAGMVVASRRVWVDPENLAQIFKDDRFRQLKDFTEAEFGDIVVYRDDKGAAVHVGIVYDKNLADKSPDSLTVLSKWGGDGEYIHDMSYVPKVCGTPREIWTDRYRP